MMKTVTRQQMIDNIREHFSKPDAVFAIDIENRTCLYRGNNDPFSPKRCAFGVQIPDEFYKSSFENRIASDVVYSDENLTRMFSSEDDEFIDEFQTIHDAFARTHHLGPILRDARDHIIVNEDEPTIENFLKRINEFAEANGLT